MPETLDLVGHSCADISHPVSGMISFFEMLYSLLPVKIFFVFCSSAVYISQLSCLLLQFMFRMVSLWFSLFSVMGFIILTCRLLVIIPRKALLPICKLRNLPKRSLSRFRKRFLRRRVPSLFNLDDLSKSCSIFVHLHPDSIFVHLHPDIQLNLLIFRLFY